MESTASRPQFQIIEKPRGHRYGQKSRFLPYVSEKHGLRRPVTRFSRRGRANLVLNWPYGDYGIINSALLGRRGRVPTFWFPSSTPLLLKQPAPMDEEGFLAGTQSEDHSMRKQNKFVSSCLFRLSLVWKW
jgi:hypothetical protein